MVPWVGLRLFMIVAFPAYDHLLFNKLMYEFVTTLRLGSIFILCHIFWDNLHKAYHYPNYYIKLTKNEYMNIPDCIPTSNCILDIFKPTFYMYNKRLNIALYLSYECMHIISKTVTPPPNACYECHPINRENFLIMQEFVALEHDKCNHLMT